MACKRLIDRANENGGPDNITVIVARFDGSGLRGPATDDEIGHRVFPLPDTGQTPAMPIDRVSTDAERDHASRSTSRLVGRPRRCPTPWERVGDSRSNGRDPADVSAHRRSAGRLIAMALLAVLVIGAAWFVVKLSRGTSDTTSTGAPPGSPRH